MDIQFFAMPAQIWADFVEKKGPAERPTVHFHTITVFATGEVKVR